MKWCFESPEIYCDLDILLTVILLFPPFSCETECDVTYFGGIIPKKSKFLKSDLCSNQKTYRIL